MVEGVCIGLTLRDHGYATEPGQAPCEGSVQCSLAAAEPGAVVQLTQTVVRLDRAYSSDRVRLLPKLDG